MNTKRKIDEDKAVTLFATIDGYNWDHGIETLERLIKRKDFDRGAALLTYWRADPHYHLKFNNESEAKDAGHADSWRLIQNLESALIAEKYPLLISFNPRDEITKSSPATHKDYVRTLPSVVYETTPGSIEAAAIAKGLAGPRAMNTAAEKNDVETLKAQIANGRNVDFKWEQCTPLTKAIQAGITGCCKLFSKSRCGYSQKSRRLPADTFSRSNTSIGSAIKRGC